VTPPAILSCIPSVGTPTGSEAPVGPETLCCL
jgi:hypothetical protein